MSQKRDPPKCYECKQIITFDDQHIGKNGKKIPLDPATHQPHDCPMREKRTVSTALTSDLVRGRYDDEEDKDDHGNELVTSKGVNIEELGRRLNDSPEDKKYVDHTLKGQSRVIIFYGRPDNVAEEYNAFLSKNNGKLKTQGAQFQTAQQDDGSVLFAIALYYEEVK